MITNPGSQAHVTFFLTDVLNALVNGDALPTATLCRNGVDDSAVPVTVALGTITGRYTATFTVPVAYIASDSVELIVTAVIGGVTVMNRQAEIVIPDKTGFQAINSLNKYHFDASTKILTTLKDDGTALGTTILTFALDGSIASRL